jgi:hypothetical protein
MTSLKTSAVVAALAATALGAVACDNSRLTDVNENPNAATSAPAPALFTNATRNAVSRWFGAGYDMRGTEFTAQHHAEVQYPDEDAYKRLQGGFTTGIFDGAYQVEQEDFQKVVDAGTEANNALIYGPALVMRTWGFGYITDTWGDVPYFDALKGDVVGSSFSPNYDKQQAIYADFFTVLNKASVDMAAAPASGIADLGGADPIYRGKRLPWQRFANSLKARFAMRIVNVDPATAKTQFLAAMAAPGGLFTSNADNALFNWPGDGVYDNPWAANLKTRDDNRLSNTLVDIMAPTGDPRLPVYGMPAESDNTFRGLKNALSQGEASGFLTTTSRPGAIFFPGATAYGTFGGNGARLPSYLLTYAEVSFLLAEAAERGWIAGSAATFYNQGIQASMEQWGVTDAAAIAAYLARPEVAYTPGAAGLTKIAIQKWIALYTDGGQAWAEWRRTCQPATIRPGPTAITNEVIRRFQYSTTENAVNEEGEASALANQGPDEFLTRIYWDKNPTAAPTWIPGCGVR